MTESEELEAARMKVKLRADDLTMTVRRHACPECGMVHFIRKGGTG